MRVTLAPASGAMLFTAMEGLSLIVGFLMQPLLMRALGPAGYGSYALACAMGVVAYTVTDFGFNFAGVKRAVELAGDDDAVHRHFWAVQVVKAVAGGGLMLAGVAWAATEGTQQAWWILLAMGIGSVAAFSFPLWFLFSRQKVLAIASSQLAARVFCLCAVIALVHDPRQLTWALLFTLGAPVLAALFLLADPEVRKQLRPCAPRSDELRLAARSGMSMLWLSGHGVAVAAVTQSLLLNYTTSATLGIFAAADRVRAGVQGLFAAFGAAVFPRFIEQQASGQASTSNLLHSLFRWQMSIALAVATILFVLTPQIVSALLGAQYQESIHVLRVLAFALLTTTFLSAVGVQVLIPRGRGLQYTLATLSVLGIQCAAMPFLAPRMGAEGAAWAVVLSEGVVAAVLLAAYCRRRMWKPCES